MPALIFHPLAVPRRELPRFSAIEHPKSCSIRRWHRGYPRNHFGVFIGVSNILADIIPPLVEMKADVELSHFQVHWQ
jgi:hypothetical protein